MIDVQTLPHCNSHITLYWSECTKYDDISDVGVCRGLENSGFTNWFNTLCHNGQYQMTFHAIKGWEWPRLRFLYQSIDHTCQSLITCQSGWSEKEQFLFGFYVKRPSYLSSVLMASFSLISNISPCFRPSMSANLFFCWKCFGEVWARLFLSALQKNVWKMVLIRSFDIVMERMLW